MSRRQRARARFSLLEMVSCLALCGGAAAALAAMSPPRAREARRASMPHRERALARAAANERLASLLALPRARLPEACAGARGAFAVPGLRPATPGQAVGSTELLRTGERSSVVVRVVWRSADGRADRLELRRRLEPKAPAADRAQTAAAARAAPRCADLPYDVDAATLLTSGWALLLLCALACGLRARPPRPTASPATAGA
ncbi:MAG: hypothetical protein D6731_04745 [Planctomycetota bacterium]|nr:MAG: hypothetical protein D6731_04745 [Planctomycetota bacterium]